MKFFIPISLSFLILFQGIVGNMDLCEQMEKISQLVSNYQDHKKVDGYSFLEYVYNDYINDHGNSEDHHPDSDHENAPFHIHHQCCQNPVFVTPFLLSLNKVDSKEKQVNIDHRNLQLTSTYLETLIQPPKV